MPGRFFIGLVTLLSFFMASCGGDTTEPDTSGTGIEGGVVSSASGDITFEIQDADDRGAPRYRLIFRFDGDDVTIKSFVEL